MDKSEVWVALSDGGPGGLVAGELPAGDVGGAGGGVGLLPPPGVPGGLPRCEVNGWYIGSGAVESACKTVVGSG